MPDPLEGQIDVDALIAQLQGQTKIAPVVDPITPAPIEEEIDLDFSIDPKVAAIFPYTPPDEVTESSEGIGRFAGQVGVGFVETLGSVPKVAEWLTTTTIGEEPEINKWIPRSGILKNFNDNIDKWVSDRTPEDMDLSDQIARGLGGIPLFFIPAIGAARIATAAKAAPKIANYFSIGTMAVLDSASAAGMIYSDELKKTGDVSRASDIATKVFLANLPLSIVADRYGIFGDISRSGALGVAERATKGAVAGALAAGAITPIISTIRGEEVTVADVGQSMIVGGVVAGTMGAGVQMLTKYKGKPEDYLNPDETDDVLVDAAHDADEKKAREAQGQSETPESNVEAELSDDSIRELDELTRGLAREQAADITGEPDFKLKTEDELTKPLETVTETLDAVDTNITDSILNYYAVMESRQSMSKFLDVLGVNKKEKITSALVKISDADKPIDAILDRESILREVGVIDKDNPPILIARESVERQLKRDNVSSKVTKQVLAAYDVQVKRGETYLKNSDDEALITEDIRKKAIEITGMDIKKFKKALPDNSDSMTAIVDEVTERYNNSPLSIKLQKLRAELPAKPTKKQLKVIEDTEKVLAESSIAIKLEDAKKKQKTINRKVKPKGVKPRKDVVADTPKEEIKVLRRSKKEENVMNLRERRTELLTERESLAEDIYTSELAMNDTTPEHLKLLDTMETLDNELSQIAFKLNERVSTTLMDVTQVIPEFLKLAKDVAADPKIVTDKLVEVGRAIYKTGMTLRDFTKNMKAALADVYEKFKSVIADVYNRARRILMSERGSTGIIKENKILSTMKPDEMSRIIRESDESLTSLDKSDIRKKFTPAIKLIDGTIKEGDSYKDIGNYASESAVQELGFTNDQGTFIPSSDFAPGVTATNETIKSPKESKTDVDEATNLMRSSATERAGEGKIISNSNNALTVGDIKTVLRKMKKKAKASNISLEDYLRNLGMSEKAIGEFNAYDAVQMRGNNTIKKIDRWQEAQFKDFEDQGVSIDQVMKDLDIAQPEEGKKLTYSDASKIMRYIITNLGVKTKEIIELEIILDNIADADSTSDKRNEAVKALNFAKDLLLSPQKVLGKTEIGMRLYKVLDRAQIMKEKDIEHIYGQTGINLDEVLHLIKEKSPSNEKIALVLDGQKKDDGYLNAEEKNAVKKLRETFDYMAERFVKLKSKDVAEEKLIRQLADTVRVSKNENISNVSKKLKSYQKNFNISKSGMEALDLLRMKVDDYLPHVWDRGDMIKTANEKLNHLKLTNPKSPQVAKLKSTIARLEGGAFIMQNEIPNDLFFAHMEKRKGAEGFKLDAGLALHSYMNGWAKKVYIEPAVNAAKDLYIQLPAEQKSYAKWFIMEVAGRNKRHPGSAVVSQLEWIRTLGLSLGSALVNATGIVNTITEAGTKPHAWEGFKRATTKEGLQEFYSTGLARSIPQIVAIDEVPHVIEKVRTVAGVFFNTVERGLRNHAYHTGKAQGEAMGLVGDDLVWHSIDFVNKTQHRYGIVGMAQGMRGWMGVATQFSSYPIKQAELIHSWLKEPQGIMKIMAYMGMSAGINVTMQELLNTDVSNALGVGITYGELMETGLSLSKGDWLEAEKHWKMTWSGGHGILPSSVVPVGPFIGLLGEIHDTNTPRHLSRIGGELTPVMANKLIDFYYALRDGDLKTDKFPIYSYEAKDAIGKIIEGPKDLKYTLGLRSTVLRAFGPKPNAETVIQAQEYSRFTTDTQIKKILKQYDKAMLNGDSDAIDKLFRLYPGIVYDRGTGGAKRLQERLTKTRQERDLKRIKRQRQRASLSEGL